MKDLCKAMGIEWHDLVINIPRITCSCGVAWQGEFPMGDFMRHRNPSPTDEAFCWRALMFVLGGENAGFHDYAWKKYSWEKTREGLEPYDISHVNFMQWLLSNPARFIKLANEWCREHKEVKP